MIQFKSLRYKLLSVFGLCLIFFLIGSVVIFRQTQDVLIKSLGKSSQGMAEQFTENVNSQLFYFFQNAHGFMEMSEVQSTLKESNENYANLDSVENYIQNIDENWQNNSDEEFKTELLNNPLSEELNSFFIAHYERELATRVYQEVFITNKYGALIASTNETSDFYQADEGWWQNAVETDGFYSDIAFDESANSLVVEYSFPIFNYSNEDELIGVANVALGVDNIIQEASLQFGSNRDSRLRLINGSGQLIYSSKPDVDNYDFKNEEFWVEIVKRGDEGSFVSKENDRKKIFSFYTARSHRSFPGFNWIAIVSNDLEGYSEILSAIKNIQKNIYLTSLLFIFFVSIFAFLISNSITKPLAELANAASKMKQKKFNIRLSKKSINDTTEVGLLTREFIKTNKELKSLYEELEKKVEKRTKDLEQEKTKDEAILNSLGECLIVVNKKGKIILHNPSAEETLGIQQLRGKTWPDVLENGKVMKNKRKLATKNLPIFQSIQKKKVIHHKDISYLLPSGKEIIVNVTSSPVINNGKIEGAVLVFRDVTLEKEIEKMKDEFISLASHQLRTPLSAIRWMTEMLLAGDHGKTTKAQKVVINDIQESNKRMLQFVNQLLQMTRLEAGRTQSSYEISNLKNLVVDVMNEFGEKSKEKKLRFITDFNPSTNKINIDPQLYSEVVKNLISNAIKYSPEGGEIEIFASETDKEHIVRVSDSGPGIPVESQKHIFDKFYRSEEAYTFDPDGTGVGLYLCKKITESLGGKIWFKSSPNGTSFFFTIPKI